MADRRPRAWHLLVAPATFLLLSSVKLYSFAHQRSDIWWTPAPLSVPLAESRDRVEIYARGAPLQALLDAGRIRIAGDSSALTPAEVGLRFNNWDRVRAERIPVLLLYSAAAGAAAVVMILWLVSPRFGRVPQEGPPASDRR